MKRVIRRQQSFSRNKASNKNNSKNGLLEVSLAFHGKAIENIYLFNDSTYKGTPGFIHSGQSI